MTAPTAPTAPNATAAVGAPLLELRGVHAAYGDIEVLHGIDLTVPAGCVVALLGPNGSGKSTALKVCSGVLRPTAGEIRMAGRPVNGVAPDVLARLGVCTVPEGHGIFPNLTVRENLWLDTQVGVALRDVEALAYERFPQLGSRRGQLAGTLSGGEQQMLAMARALATDPALLLLDELSTGLGPIVVSQLYEIVAQMSGDGISILVVEQFARTVLGIADYAVVLSSGRVVHVGRPSDIEEQLSAAYLGV
jgi:branched-chain amino acid transport system ATP-binding protein